MTITPRSFYDAYVARYGEESYHARYGQKRNKTEMTIDWTKPIENKKGALHYVCEIYKNIAIVKEISTATIYLVNSETGIPVCSDLNSEWTVRNVPEESKIETRKENKMTIDWNKPIETVIGEKLHCIGKRKNGLMVVEKIGLGQYPYGRTYEVIAETGYYCDGDKTQSVRNVPEEPEIEKRWLNVYPPILFGCDSKEEADNRAGIDRTGLIEITYKDGKPFGVKLHTVDE